MEKASSNQRLYEWYQRNRLKYWVVVFLTVGFVIGLPFVILGLILEIKYHKNQNISKEDNDEEDLKLENIDFDSRLNYKNDLNDKKDRKQEEIQSVCPKCGSNAIEVYRLPPFFTKKYICEDCEYSWSSKNKISKEKRKITRYICSNCGSYNVKPHVGGITGVYYCIDCNFVGLPFMEEWDPSIDMKESIGRI